MNINLRRPVNRNDNGRRGCARINRKRRSPSRRLRRIAAWRDRISRVNRGNAVGTGLQLRGADRHAGRRRRRSCRHQSLRRQQSRSEHVIYRAARYPGSARNSQHGSRQSRGLSRLQSVGIGRQGHADGVVQRYASILVRAYVNARTANAWIPENVGAAVNRVGGTAVRIAPPDGATQARAARGERRRIHLCIEIRRHIANADQLRIRIQRIRIFSGGRLIARKAGKIALAPQEIDVPSS